MQDVTYAVVTGASRGLGRAFAHALAERKQSLILVSRSKETLAALAEELETAHSISTLVFECDLAAPSAGCRLARLLLDRRLSINLLVNNAGFGLRGSFLKLSLQRQMEMLRLNNSAVVELTFSLLPSLLGHSQAGIINVSSTAGFQAVPYAGVYAATKSFLTSFSTGLQEELRSSGVRVVTLCPGRILASRPPASTEDSNRRFSFAYQLSEDVVERALEALANGGGLVIPGFANKFSLIAQRFIPRRTVPKLVALLSRQ